MATKKDFTQVAHAVFQRAVGEASETQLSERQQAGSKGGTRGGKARMQTLTDEQRVELAKRAAAARWNREAAPDSKAGAGHEVKKKG